MKKKFLIVLIILLIVCAGVIQNKKIKRFLYEAVTEDYLEIPEEIFEMEKNMVKTDQTVELYEYTVKLVGVSRQTKKDGEPGSVYMCKFDIYDPDLNMKDCLRIRGSNINLPYSLSDEIGFGQNIFISNPRNIAVINSTGYSEYTYMRFHKKKIELYWYYSNDETQGKITNCTYVKGYISGNSGVEHYDRTNLTQMGMSGVFNIDIQGNEKKFKYKNDAEWDISVTDNNIYINGTGTEDIEQFLIHMKNGKVVDVNKDCIEYGEDKSQYDIIQDGIYDLGTYEPDEYVKTYTRLIHFMAGTDVENIDHLEINGQILK